MATQVSKTDLVANLAKHFDHITKKDLKAICDHLIEDMEKNLVKGHKIRLDKIGVFEVKNRAARTGRNPQTGEEIHIPASKKVAFRAAKSLKEQVVGSRKSAAKSKKKK
jgi:DNA-binding protein HU-beta